MNNDLNHDNPYAVSYSVSGLDTVVSDGAGFAVDGDLVRVGKSTHLPPICVVSGEEDDLVSVSKKLSYASPVIIVAFLLSPIIGLIIFLIIRKQCEVRFYISRAVRSRGRLFCTLGVVGLIAAVAVFVGLISSGALDQYVALLILPLILLITGIVLLVKGNNALAVAKFVAPDQFWLKGFKPPFFTSLSQMPEDMYRQF